MNKYYLVFFITFLVSACKHDPILPAPDACQDGIVNFQDDVLPLIIASCASSDCHDASFPKEGVNLSTYNKIIKTGEVKAGNPNESKLYEVLFKSGEDRMPPPPAAPLSDAQKELIKTWIEQGAHDTKCDNIICDTLVEVSYANHISPIIVNKCAGCHSANSPQGGVTLNSYSTLKTYVISGALLGSIKHETNYAPMPPGIMLIDCEIQRIQAWIDAGAPNN